MKMVRAIVRPNKVGEVLSELSDAGFPAVTKIDVAGRGKQRGIKVGDVHYDEIPKEMLLLIVNDEDKDDVVKTILKAAKKGEKGNFIYCSKNQLEALWNGFGGNEYCTFEYLIVLGRWSKLNEREKQRLMYLNNSFHQINLIQISTFLLLNNFYLLYFDFLKNFL